MRAGAATEERALTQLRAARVALAVLGDVGRARPGRVQAVAPRVPSSRSTSPSTDVASPPTVNPAYIALPSDISNAPHGPLSCGARNSGCLWKSGSSPVRGVLVVAVQRRDEVALRDAERGFHFGDRFPSVDQRDQRHRGVLQVRLVDDQIRRAVGLIHDETRSPGMVGVFGDEPLAELVDDDPGEQDRRRVRRAR